MHNPTNHTLSNNSSLAPMHTAHLHCDHCGLHHTGVSDASLSAAFTHARLLLDQCREYRKWVETSTADSVRNQHNAPAW